MDDRIYGEWDHLLENKVKELGGWLNAHTHLDRANTISRHFLSHMNIEPLEAASLSLRVKQNLVGYLHTGLAYQPENLYERMKKELERAIILGTREIVSFIDATPDIGLTAINEAAKLREEFKEKIKLRIAISPIFGFKNPKEDPDRWEIYKAAAEISDVLGGLPSRDEGKGRIGFDSHVKMVIQLGQELGKEAHFQIDQNNDPRENETEKLIDAVRWLGSPEIKGSSEPTVWAVHAISPSCYSEERFRTLIDGLLKYNIGVICCPSAAISMFQLRPISTPIHNSIARILDMAEAGVPVRIGTDNICDVFVPNGDGKIESEIWLAANLLRFYSINAWSKIGAGIMLNEVDRELIRNALSRAERTWEDLNL